MTTPTYLETYGDGCYFARTATADSASEIPKYIIPSMPHNPPKKLKSHAYWGTDEPNCFIAVQIDGKFRAVPSIYRIRPDNNTLVFNCGPITSHRLYYPVDSAMTAVDINGAESAEPNSTNTGWTFRHTRDGSHHDHELAVESAIEVRFQKYINTSLVKRLDATTGTKRERIRKYNHLLEFFNDAMLRARANARKRHLGYMHQNPHPTKGHVWEDSRQAILDTQMQWTTDKSKKQAWRDVSETVGKVVAELHHPTIRTRWEIAAAEAAAKKKKAAEAEE